MAEAESLYVTLAAVYRRRPGASPIEALGALLRIAQLRTDAGDLRGAVATYDSLMPYRVLRTRDDSIDEAAFYGSRGVALVTLGLFDRATQDFAAALALNEKLLGADSFATGQLLQPYAGAMMFTGNLAAAESLAHRVSRLLSRANRRCACGCRRRARWDADRSRRAG